MRIRRWHKLRSGAAYLAILGLLLQSLFVMLHASSAFAAMAAGATEAGADSVIICTGHGFERVAIDEGEGTPDDDGTQTLYKTCPGCLGTLGTPGIAHLVVLPVPSGFAFGESYSAVQESATGRADCVPRSRGPPLQI